MTTPNKLWILRSCCKLSFKNKEGEILHLWNNTHLFSTPKQGSPHTKTGRLAFSLREHEGEVKAWQGDFQQLHRDMFPLESRVGDFSWYMARTSPTSPGLVSPAPKDELCIWFVMCCRLWRGLRPHRSEKIGYNAILHGFLWGTLITSYSTIKTVVTSRRGHKCFVKHLYISSNIFLWKFYSVLQCKTATCS